MKLLQKLSILVLLAGTACTRSNSQTQTPAEAQLHPVELQLQLHTPFHFVAYGDSRFHNTADTEAANPAVRQALVKAIAQTNPTFVCMTGDIVYNGHDKDDWKIWDTETSIWREQKIPVFPALGNHDLHGNENEALGNYFQRFPDLKNSRYYAVRAANTLILFLDSSLDETSGPQGQWLTQYFDRLASDVDFVFVVLHHPPYTSSSDRKMYGGGHSARSPEQKLAQFLEDRQKAMRARIVVFSGHVHNYERHEHGGIVYFVSGGAGAHAYPVERAPGDPFQSKEINYHYLQVDVDRGTAKIVMHRLDLSTGSPVWTEPDAVTITASVGTAAAAGD